MHFFPSGHQWVLWNACSPVKHWELNKQRKSNIHVTNWCWSSRIIEVSKPNLIWYMPEIEVYFCQVFLSPHWKAHMNNMCMQKCCCGGFYISLMVFQLGTLKRSLINTEWMGTQHACKQMELFLSLGQWSTERQATCHYAKDASSGFALILRSLPSSPSLVSYHCLLLQFYLSPFVSSLLFSCISAICCFLKQMLSHFSADLQV